MYKLPNIELSQSDLSDLARSQDLIDVLKYYHEKVDAAKSSFASKPTPLFKRIRDALASMAGDLVRCAYCEDSCADEVEHIRPKDFFPECTYIWRNYLFSCGPCNGGKGNRYPILAGSTQIDLQRHRKTSGVVPPPTGIDLFINPRSEDPLAFLWMDVAAGTFMFSSLDEDDLVSDVRAVATIDILRLNREPLRQARQNAFGGYRDRLAQLADRKAAGASEDELASRRADISRSPHRTVWLEMKRQKRLVSELEALFGAVPEASKL